MVNQGTSVDGNGVRLPLADPGGQSRERPVKQPVRLRSNSPQADIAKLSDLDHAVKGRSMALRADAAPVMTAHPMINQLTSGVFSGRMSAALEFARCRQPLIDTTEQGSRWQ
jgi:hypothetical protein